MEIGFLHCLATSNFRGRWIEFMDICMEYIVHTPFVLTSERNNKLLNDMHVHPFLSLHLSTVTERESARVY